MIYLVSVTDVSRSDSYYNISKYRPDSYLYLTTNPHPGSLFLNDKWEIIDCCEGDEFDLVAFNEYLFFNGEKFQDRLDYFGRFISTSGSFVHLFRIVKKEVLKLSDLVYPRESCLLFLRQHLEFPSTFMEDTRGNRILYYHKLYEDLGARTTAEGIQKKEEFI